LYKLYTNTEIIGKNLIYLPKCHSTNDIASELLKKKDLDEGSIIITDHQESGRGQRGNQWLAAAQQNLTMSIIFKPQFLNIADNFYLNIFISLAIRDFLSTILGNNVKIKWPNDIYYQNSKICGILIENFLKSHHISHSIVGIGLNVNQNEFSIANATSLYQITNQRYNLEGCLNNLIHHLEKKYLELKKLDLKNLKMEYYKNMYWFAENRVFKSDHEFEGTIAGIDDNGKLQIVVDRDILSFDLKEVTFVR